jgi:hypothetical protein
MIPAAGGDIAWTGRTFLTLGENGLIRHEYQFTVDTPTEHKASTRAKAEDFLRRLGEGNPDRIAELFAEHVNWQLNWPDSGDPAVPWIRPRSTRADVADHFREIAAFHVPEKSAGTASRPAPSSHQVTVVSFALRADAPVPGFPCGDAAADRRGLPAGQARRRRRLAAPAEDRHLRGDRQRQECCKSQLRGDCNPTTTHDRHHASTRNGRTRPAVTGTHGHQRKDL